jgi:hypothetical protein
MPLTPEMNPLQAEIGSNQRLLAGGNFENGAVISNASGYPTSSDSPVADARDQSLFGEWHDGPTIQGARLLDRKSRNSMPVTNCRNSFDLDMDGERGII